MSKDNLRDHYERKYSAESGLEDVEKVELHGAPMNRFEAAVDFIPKHFRGGDILELGAGKGNVAKTLLDADNGIVSYTLGDISMPRVEGLRKSLDDSRVQVMELDAENIAVDQFGKYDAVIMIALIEHLVDPLRAMQQINRLLKPGGFVYIDTPNIARYTQRAKLLLGKFPSTASRNEGLETYDGEPVDLHDEGHLHYFTYRSLSLMLTERCGFSRIEKLAYAGGKTILGKHIHVRLARMWPEMFSELVLLAYR